MPRQSSIWADTEGDRWYQRNKGKLPVEDDPVLRAIERVGLHPENVLEIGCADGWRLHAIRERYDSRCTGIELSSHALHEGRQRYRGITLLYGAADTLGAYHGGEFDLVIFGFCLYMLDRDSLFDAVAGADRALQDQGHVIVYDFLSETPHSTPYTHDERLQCYKMCYSNLFTANPAYRLVVVAYGPESTAAIVLRKDIEKGWPPLVAP
jgi:hypothetical protein